MEILYILTHSIEPYKLNPKIFSDYDAYPHMYCRIAREYGYDSTLCYPSLSVETRVSLTHKYGHQMTAYPVTLNGGYFGYEVSKELLEDVIRSDTDIIHIHSYYLIMYDLVTLAKKLNGKPLIAHYHGGDPNMLLNPFRALKKITLRLADKVIVTNRTEMQRLLKYWRLPKEKVVYIPNGVDTDLFRPLTNIDKEDNTVLFVGNLVLGKGLELLISAFLKCKQELKQLKLLIVGEGYMRLELEKEVRVQGLLEDVKFLGRVSHEQLSGIYNRAAVTVLPSKKEGFGLVLAESMACATPVVATVNDGSKDIIANGVDGLLVSQNDAEVLSKAICKLVSDINLRRKMGDNARRKVTTFYSWKKVGEQLDILYKTLKHH